MPTTVLAGSSNSHKRRRTDDPEHDSLDCLPPSLPPATRAADLWFEDGSIVLQAQTTQFKVHKSMLQRHSEVFSDMFTIPHPMHSEEPKVDGCPVVYLQDKAEDVENMLVALYDRKYSPRDVISFPMVAGMIRMGRKYGMEQLWEEGLARLQSEFPAKLEEWEVLPPYYTHLKEEAGLLFDIVNLALEADLQTLLPSAYYLCLQDIDEVLSGVKKTDGSVAHLPPDVQRACVLGRDKLLVAQSEHTFSWVEALGEDASCQRPMSCARTGMKLFRDIWLPVPEVSRTLEKWTDFLEGSAYVEDLCASCFENARRGHEEGRKQVWVQLPEWLGLSKWDKLKNM